MAVTPGICVKKEIEREREREIERQSERARVGGD